MYLFSLKKLLSITTQDSVIEFPIKITRFSPAAGLPKLSLEPAYFFKFTQSLMLLL
jgi:hypothetical protein